MQKVGTPSAIACRPATAKNRASKREPPQRSRRGRSKPAVRVIRVWAIIWICRCRRIRVVIRRAGRGGADYSTRRDAGGNATPTWPMIAPAPVVTATADVDVPVHVDVVSVDVGGIEVSTVDVGGIEVPAVDVAAIASGDTGPGTAPGGTAAVETSAVGAGAGEPAAGTTTAAAISAAATTTTATTAAKTA